MGHKAGGFQTARQVGRRRVGGAALTQRLPGRRLPVLCRVRGPRPSLPVPPHPTPAGVHGKAHSALRGPGRVRTTSSQDESLILPAKTCFRGEGGRTWASRELLCGCVGASRPEAGEGHPAHPPPRPINCVASPDFPQRGLRCPMRLRSQDREGRAQGGLPLPTPTSVHSPLGQAAQHPTPSAGPL